MRRPRRNAWSFSEPTDLEKLRVLAEQLEGPIVHSFIDARQVKPWRLFVLFVLFSLFVCFSLLIHLFGLFLSLFVRFCCLFVCFSLLFVGLV